MQVSDKNYTRTESRNGSESSFLGSSRFPCCGTAPCEDPPKEGVIPRTSGPRDSRALPLSETQRQRNSRLGLVLPDWPQVRQQPRTRRIGRNPYVPLLSHSGCNHGYARLGYELPQILLQLTLQLFDGEPSGVN